MCGYVVCVLDCRVPRKFHFHFHPGAANWYNTQAIYQVPHLCCVSWGWASNARNLKRPLFHNNLNKTCITLVSLYCYTRTHGLQNIKVSTPGKVTIGTLPQYYSVLNLPSFRENLLPVSPKLGKVPPNYTASHPAHWPPWEPSNPHVCESKVCQEFTP
jgi:hypothetical protein